MLEHRSRVIRNIELAQLIARDNTYKAQQRMKIYYDCNTAEPTFVEGDFVWVFTPKTRKGLTKKSDAQLVWPLPGG